MHPLRMMKPLAGLLACTAVAACSTSTNQVVVAPTVQPQQTALARPVARLPLQKGAESGKKQVMNQLFALNPDCSPVGDMVMTVVKPPANGQMTSEKGEGYPGFPKDNPRSACNTQKVPSTLLYYTSNTGFTGTDYATVEFLGPMGNVYRNDYVITVR